LRQITSDLEGKAKKGLLHLPVYYFHRMQKWMVGFLEKNGFIGVFLMACWPNAAFDLCGICCGHFQMKFSTFFSATLLGKGFVLRPVQAAILVGLFSNHYRQIIVHHIVRCPVCVFFVVFLLLFFAQTSQGFVAPARMG
jgi:uncharacterized membrane protein YdjX (TVP38/TMEM64 family)